MRAKMRARSLPTNRKFQRVPNATVAPHLFQALDIELTLHIEISAIMVPGLACLAVMPPILEKIGDIERAEKLFNALDIFL